MNPQVGALIERIKALESELDAELAKRTAELRIGLKQGRIIFDRASLKKEDGPRP